VILFFTAILQRFDLLKSEENDDLPTMGIHTGVTLQPQPFKMCFRQRTWENIWFSKCVLDKGLERTFDFQSVFRQRTWQNIWFSMCVLDKGLERTFDFQSVFRQRTWENIWFSMCVLDKGLQRTFDFQCVF
jgi:hypothetical protein